MQVPQWFDWPEQAPNRRHTDSTAQLSTVEQLVRCEIWIHLPGSASPNELPLSTLATPDPLFSARAGEKGPQIWPAVLDEQVVIGLGTVGAHVEQA